MNEFLQTQIAQFLEVAKTGIIKGVELAQEQIPDLVHQLLSWEIATGIVVIILGILIMALISRPLIRWGRKAYDGYREAPIFAMVGGYISLIAGVVMIIINVCNLKPP